MKRAGNEPDGLPISRLRDTIDDVDQEIHRKDGDVSVMGCHDLGNGRRGFRLGRDEEERRTREEEVVKSEGRADNDVPKEHRSLQKKEQHGPLVLEQDKSGGDRRQVVWPRRTTPGVKTPERGMRFDKKEVRKVITPRNAASPG